MTKGKTLVPCRYFEGWVCPKKENESCKDGYIQCCDRKCDVWKYMNKEWEVDDDDGD